MRRKVIQLLSVMVIAIGGTHLHAQEAEEERPDACCTAALTDATCCGDFCTAGLFRCMASKT